MPWSTIISWQLSTAHFRLRTGHQVQVLNSVIISKTSAVDLESMLHTGMFTKNKQIGSENLSSQ